MKRVLVLLTAIATLVSFNGCKKDDGTGLAIYGLWQVTSSTQLPNLKFIRFTNNKTMTAYSETPEGFRSMVITNFSPNEDQVIANFLGGYYPLTVYNYSIDAEQITLIGENGQTFLVATRSSSAAPDSWTTDVTSVDKIENLFTDNSDGIGYDGSNLLFSDYSNGKIIKVSLATRSITGQINTVNSINTIEYDGTNYWVSRNGYDNLEKINPSGTSLLTTANMGSWLYGIGYVSPNSIICYSNNEHTLYNYNPGSNTVDDSKLIEDIYLGDIAVSNGKVYIILRNSNLIYRLNPTTFEVEKTYRVTDGTDLYGIASVGSNTFWLNTQSGKKILKVELN